MVSAERLAVIREYLERKGTLPDLYARELLADRDALAARVEAMETERNHWHHTFLLRDGDYDKLVEMYKAEAMQAKALAAQLKTLKDAIDSACGEDCPGACHHIAELLAPSPSGGQEGGMSEDAFVIAACGPSSSRCRCACPADCEHVWDGPWRAHEDGRGGSATCSRCHMDMLDHDRWVLP